ncbi:MAG: hypothetical protein Q9227_001788 [Pyrenula ochraceoflavens]
MPSFSTYAAPAVHATMPSRLPPTPPEYQPGYSNALSEQACFYPSQPLYAHQFGQSGRDFLDRYSQSSAYSAQQSLTAQHQSRFGPQTGHDLNQVTPYRTQMPARSYGSMAAAPILPPIRPQDPVADPLPPQYRPHETQVRTETKQKEERATGGVAAHLDYELDMMADFVAEMSQGMYALYDSPLRISDIDLLRSVTPGVAVSSQYRKYVLQILSSTRLPSSTIMLGLFYMAERMKILSDTGVDTRSSGTVYRMLTTGLLLGSKFLDDNTFQNRSWAEVSSIPVAELNKMELEWLFSFGWTIHGPMYHQTEGFHMWRQQWLTYKENMERAAKAKEAQKLAPIDTDIRRSHSFKRPLMSPDGPIPPQYQPSTHYDAQWTRSMVAEYSPPSAPHSGSTTPEYYNTSSWSYAQPPPPYSRQSWGPMTAASVPGPRSQPPSYHHTPSYNQPYARNQWTAHGASCGCLMCAKYHESYFNPAGNFRVQSVAG